MHWATIEAKPAEEQSWCINKGTNVCSAFGYNNSLMSSSEKNVNNNAFDS